MLRLVLLARSLTLQVIVSPSLHTDWHRVRKLLCLEGVWLVNSVSSEPWPCRVQVKLTSWGSRPSKVQRSWMQPGSLLFCLSRTRPGGTAEEENSTGTRTTVNAILISYCMLWFRDTKTSKHVFIKWYLQRDKLPVTWSSTAEEFSMVGGGMTLDMKQVYRPESVLFGSVTYSLGGCPVTLNWDLQDTTELISLFTLYSQIMPGLPIFFHLKTTFPSNPKGEGQGRWEGLPSAALTFSLKPAEPNRNIFQSKVNTIK